MRYECERQNDRSTYVHVVYYYYYYCADTVSCFVTSLTDYGKKQSSYNA